MHSDQQEVALHSNNSSQSSSTQARSSPGAAVQRCLLAMYKVVDYHNTAVTAVETAPALLHFTQLSAVAMKTPFTSAVYIFALIISCQTDSQ
jgi:uncharacterized membrane protein YjdF